MNKAGCDYDALASAVDQAAVAAGTHLSQYRRKVYFFPTLSDCGRVGLGTVGGNPSRSWINGSFSLRVVGHELGHNVGLQHATARDCANMRIDTDCTAITYGDPVDIMGAAASAHYGSSNKERWAGSAPAFAGHRMLV